MAISVSRRSPTMTHSRRVDPERGQRDLENDGRGLAHDDLHRRVRHRLHRRDHPRAVRDLAVLGGTRPVGVGGDEASPAARTAWSAVLSLA